jgi:hypothetical protein
LPDGKEVQMKWMSKATKAILFIAALEMMFFFPPVNAQTQPEGSMSSPQPKEADPDAGWHVGITPYIWFAGVHGTVGALGHEISVHASFGDIFDYLNIGVMATADVRYNRVLMPVDFLWMKLSDNKALPLTDVAESIKAQMTETVLTPKIGYRFVNGKRLKVDALFGIRYWHLTTNLTLQPVQLAGGISQSASWVDSVSGARFTAALTPKAIVTVLGDAGGGSARLDYQVAGFLGYRVSRKCILQLGYRYLSVNYRPNGNLRFVYDVNMPGVVAGLTINVK